MFSSGCTAFTDAKKMNYLHIKYIDKIYSKPFIVTLIIYEREFFAGTASDSQMLPILIFLTVLTLIVTLSVQSDVALFSRINSLHGNFFKENDSYLKYW